MVPDDDREPKAAVAVLARALGESEAAETAPTVGEQSAAVLGDEIVKYIECHESSRLLRMHALRAGDGLTIARALGRVHRHYGGAGDDTDNEAAESADPEAAAPAFSLDLYPSPEQRAIAGRFIAEAREKRRSGAGVLAADDQWMLESISLPGGVALPRLRWARKESGDPSTAAHLAVAFDTFESQVEIDTGAAPTAPFRAFGLLSFFERDFAAVPTPSWRSVVPRSGGGEKHPSERGHTERLDRLGQKIVDAVARHVAEGDGEPTRRTGWRWPWAASNTTDDAGQGAPVLRTTILPEKADSIRELHRLSDWVVTLDRNAGVEYFDSPRDNRDIYDAYVIDCVPEREDLGCLQLITSTSNVEEVHDLLDDGTRADGTQPHAAERRVPPGAPQVAERAARHPSHRQRRPDVGTDRAGDRPRQLPAGGGRRRLLDVPRPRLPRAGGRCARPAAPATRRREQRRRWRRPAERVQT